jgi:Tol biopolymer transport system component
LKADVAHYLTLGGASFRGWSTSRRSAIVTTRSGNAVQLFTVAEPLGKRMRLTQGNEPVNYGWFQPRGGKWFVFVRDSNGDEQYQFYALDSTRPGSKPVLLTDGVSRNTGIRWSSDGQLLAYASTRRDGKDNDIYIVDPVNPGSTRCLAQNKSPSWDVECWNHNSTKILLRHGVSDTKTELWSVDVRSGEKTLLTKPDDMVYLDRPRFAEDDTAIYGMGYDHSDFLVLLRLDLKTGRHEPLTEHIKWDLENFEISPDGDTVAFVTNEDGFGRLHLLDVSTRREMPVPRIPGDLINDLSWR